MSYSINFKNFNWGPGIFLIAYQALILLAMPFYFYYAPPSLSMVLISVLLLYITGLSITGGYHRYFSHRSFKAHPAVEWCVLFFASMAGQGSALRWAYDHRLHHAYVDTDRDPYSIKKGFWYAHFLWILEKPQEIDPKVVPDLMKNPRVMHQHRFSGLWMVFTNVIAFFAVGWLLDDYVGAFFLAVWIRMLALHHFTWFINSLAHTWGDRPFSQEQSAVNNYIISFLTFGEGYHNYHHTFANDYRNGVRWYHFDPTKWLIWCLHRCGIAYNLKTVDWETISRRLVIERKVLLIDKIKELWTVNKEELENKVNRLSEDILAKISALTTLREQYRQFKRDYVNQDMLQEIRKEIKALKASMRADWRSWHRLYSSIQAMG
jgi:stearoyl-CoA desaturase (delta-9 desaturase)